MTIQKTVLSLCICISLGIIIGSHTLQPMVLAPGILAFATLLSLVILPRLAGQSWLSMLVITGLCATSLGISIGASTMANTLDKRPSNSTSTHATLMIMGLSSHAGFYQAYIQPSAANLAPHKTTIALAHGVTPGQCFQGMVQIAPYQSLASPFAFDASAWMLSQGVISTSRAINLQTSTHCPRAIALADRIWHFAYMHFTSHIDQARLQLRQYFAATQLKQPLAMQQGYAVTLSLLTGDDADISQPTKSAYQQLGISHLLVISGPHVLMAAIMLSYSLLFLVSFFPQVYRYIPKQRLHRWILISGTWLYALFAGFDPPAIRTAVMATVAIISFTPLTAICLAACIMLLINPLLALSVSFYLSFVSVLILATFIRQLANHSSWQQTLWAYMQTQWLTFIALTPIILYVFHSIPLFAPIANIIVSPIISFVILPLNLIAAALHPFFPVLADLCWHAIAATISAFNQYITSLGIDNPTFVVVASAAIMMALAATVLQFASHLSLRYRFVVFLTLLLCTVVWQIPSHRAPLTITQLDVGQGLSIVMQTPKHTILYDTGGAKIDYATGQIKHTMGERIIVPYLRGKQIRKLDAIIISHDDLDHTGGLNAVLEAYPNTPVFSSQPLSKHISQPCTANMQWRLDNVHLQFLAPTAGESYSTDNDRSCVLRVSYSDHNNTPYSALIMGDAEYQSEQGLMLKQRQYLDVDLLFVGHHGSKTSSAENFIKEVSPRYAILSYGHNNNYGHPHHSVVKTLSRYSTTVHSNTQLGTTVYKVNTDKGEWQYAAHRNRRAWLLAPSVD